MIAALGLGAVLFARRKGTPAHVTLGRGFVGAVLASNLIVFGIHEDSPGIGVFHVLAVVSFLSVVAGAWLVRFGRGAGTRVAHGHVMLWSFAGLIAAGLGQGATALGFSPWPAIFAVLLGTGTLAVRLDIPAMVAGR